MIENLRIRQRSETREESLSPYAVRSKHSKGREGPEAPDPIRTAFQRDRDRIIHTNAFRRLKHKTQVFIAPLGDHYVTRLTHTLEVSQIARTIARALNLNEDLTEAISLGHDLGHTPFGHIGEDVLNELYHVGFRHNEQSLRVVEKLEKNGAGLNLTWEVRDGILNHSKGERSLFGTDRVVGNTFESEVVKISDAIAYINHDIGDAMRAGLLTEGDLPLSPTNILGHSHSERVNTMVTDIIENSWAVSGEVVGQAPIIQMSEMVGKATDELRDFMFEHVYNVQSENKDAKNARRVVKALYQYLVKHEEHLPPEYLGYSEEAERRVVDFIAGMTDQYALNLAKELGL
jgi:dGTPase